MYNLYVGNSVDFVDDSWIVTPLDNPTGMQSVNAIGGNTDCYENCNLPYIGTTAFSTDEVKGINYGDYNGSLIERYVNNYKAALETKFGVEVVEARLITKDELIDPNTFACREWDTCEYSPYPWIYSTSYWTGTCNGNVCYRVYYMSYFHYDTCNEFDADFGVRPVIVISKDYFE